MKKFIILLLCIFLFSCVSEMHKKEMQSYNKLFSKGNYEEASNFILKDNKTIKKLLPALQAGTSLRYAKDYQKSCDIFDECEKIMKKQDLETFGEKSAKNFFSLLVNDNILDYRAREYDGVMVNTYKALNFWQIGKIDLARVEFNRALDRQRRAKDRFKKEIEKLREQIARKQEEENKKAQKKYKGQNIPKLDLEKNVYNPEIDKILRKRYSNLYNFQVYPDFINPFTTYIAGLFFMTQGDFKKADNLLKEAYGMLKDNPVVKSDFITVEKILDGYSEKQKYVWIIFENGLGPIKKEFRVDLPIFLFTNKVKYTGIALPKLVLRDKAYDFLKINNFKTIQLSSMDSVIQTEFKKRYKIIVTKAIVSTVLKTYTQYLAQQKIGKIGGWISGIYHYATNEADLRIWNSLPKEFQIAKIKIPENGKINISTPDNQKINITVDKNSNYLIYVRIPEKGAKIYYDVIKM